MKNLPTGTGTQIHLTPEPKHLLCSPTSPGPHFVTEEMRTLDEKPFRVPPGFIILENLYSKYISSKCCHQGTKRKWECFSIIKPCNDVSALREHT